MTSRLKILIATDAWKPQVNGVVRTLTTTSEMLRSWGHEVEVVEPSQFKTFAIPFYPEIPLSFATINHLVQRIRKFHPDAIHISTEGPIGLAARAICIRRKWKFTTSYHTKFPEYLKKMLFLPLAGGYSYMRRFHSRSSGIMVATPSLEQELRQRRFLPDLNRWSRGVNLSLFYQREKTHSWPKPVLMYVGRVSKEKNIEAFLKADVPGTKVVVGDGPHRSKLQHDFPKAIFVGYRRGEALAEMYSQADCFVFPSHTDTFGLVMIESLACGVPVAAYPVIGPVDVITEPGTGALNDNLALAIEQALKTASPEACLRHAQTFTWEKSTRQFLSNLRNRHTGEPFTPARIEPLTV